MGEKQPLRLSYLAGLIEVLVKSGAKVIGIDVEFNGRERPVEVFEVLGPETQA